MPTLLLYLLKVNAGIILLYLLYQLALRQTTFHGWNRAFLLAGLLLASLFPLIDFTLLFAQQPQLYETITYYSPAFPLAPAAEPEVFDVWQIPVFLFWLGAGVMAIRFLVQLASLWNIHRRSSPDSFQGISFRKVEIDLPPFSFGRAIYFNPARHPTKDWLPILRHEHTHVRQGHTIDILLMELTTLFHWFNPAVWLLRKALKENLEFLTDRQTLRAGIDKKQYQFSLLQTTGASPFSLASFSFHSLKHRIMMMNKTPSTRVQLLRFLASSPLLLLFLLLLQGTTSLGLGTASAQNQPTRQNQTPNQPYQAFLKRNPTVKRITWSSGHINVYLKSGKTEQYPSNAAGIAQAEKKYGTLPGPPPPPPAPPAPKEAALAPPPPPPPYRTDLSTAFKAHNPQVDGIAVVNDKSGRVTYFIVIPKSGDTEDYPNTPEGMAAFQKKYGKAPMFAAPVKTKKAATTKFTPPVLKKE
ncbi:MAG: M56 family metallopeptidase [Rufibacter sp.]